MSEDEANPSPSLLDPAEKASEVLFGLVMVLTITCSFSIGGAGRTEVRQMLWGAIGCNFAWGVIDAMIYLMACYSRRGQARLTLLAVREAAHSAKAHRIIADTLPPVLASVTSAAELETMRLMLNRLPEPSQHKLLKKQDWLGALAVFLLIVISTLPVALPFLFLSNARRAIRISNAVAVAMLFLCGYGVGRHVGRSPWKAGLGLVLMGSAMVAMTIALGG